MSAWVELTSTLARIGEAGRRTPCQADPDAFTGEDRTELAEAAVACDHCPARDPCAAFAAANEESAHVWGGADRTHRPTTSTDRQEAHP